MRGLKYERMKLRHALFAIDTKYKKKRKYADDESDLDDEAIATHEDTMKEKELEKVEKKFQKDNEKLAEEGKEQLDDSVLKEKLKEVEAEYKRLKKERGTRKAALLSTQKRILPALPLRLARTPCQTSPPYSISFCVS